MQIRVGDVCLDFARQRLDLNQFTHLLTSINSKKLAEKYRLVSAGSAVNTTEKRAALHIALRNITTLTPPWGEEKKRQVDTELHKMFAFVKALRAEKIRGASGEAITDVVNLGIGGSHLGSCMASHALDHYANTPIRVHYLSHIDPSAIDKLLKKLVPKRTLFIIASKTFITQETQINVATIKRWLSDSGISLEAQKEHWIAVTSREDLALASGIKPTSIFKIWDWVGGRYSIWSTMALPLVIRIGEKHFRDFLAGGSAMDQHFHNTPKETNMPIIMALLGHYNQNILGATTQVIFCYHSGLRYFVPFIQQMDMESNGKSVQIDGKPVSNHTGPIIWGGLGLEGQHSYFQLLHQGQHLVPIDFIGIKNDNTSIPLAHKHQLVNHSNLIAQARTLAIGQSAKEAGLPPWLEYPGNNPSNIIWLDKLTPYTLGVLVALYEHKIFVQSHLWNINPYDQWGIELGKKEAKNIQGFLKEKKIPKTLDYATQHSLRSLT
jgi:glucose-6-phosphate isomerase